ncbi:MAG: chemotaxis protein CheB, partial [Betaproteobacteria bacterium]
MKKPAKKSAARDLTHSFPIVGIGASAGGLEAFRRLLQRFPPDTGMALVLVQHLDPTHESELTQLLARSTSMPTLQVENNLRVEPNHVYVIPPNANLAIVDGILKLEPRPKERKPQHAIDFFFESLANDQAERAIGVVLSGTATDGTMGLEAIKNAGGITFAQDESAKYDSMPRSAIAAGCIDFVLPPEEIAEQLARIAQHPFILGSPDVSGAGKQPLSPEAGAVVAGRESETAHQRHPTQPTSDGHGAPDTDSEAVPGDAGRAGAETEDAGLKKVLILLRNHCGVDFSLYKSMTIQRRIARRMVLGLHASFADYAGFLRNDTEELDALFNDVLICVTGFFRNPEAFDVLKRVVFPRILKQRREGPVRIWVLGCSTGQEAYSVGIALAEHLETVDRPPRIQIFATDLNDALLDKARAGLYGKTQVADLSEERLARFFVEEESGFRVIKALRELVVFARQNLVSDPPFSRMDLICCRNLLIYLEPAVQKKALPMFHYALRTDGFLFLGASESVGQFTDLFDPLDKKQKIFVRKNVPVHHGDLPMASPKFAGSRQRAIALPLLTPSALSSGLSAQREADRLIVNEFAPPGVLINSDLQIIQFRGATGAYLAPPRGKASFDVLKMARDGLMLPLRAAINRARKENVAVLQADVPIRILGMTRLVTLQVIPLKHVKERCFLVLFGDIPQPTSGGTVVERRRRTAGPGRTAAGDDVHLPPPPGDAERSEIIALRSQIAEYERELAGTRDYVQAIQEQYDAASEELQASSDEARSANEELQSINEELETSKEELQSTNEELTTVNEELANRNTELNRLNADLSNLHVSIHTAILVLGRDLRIRRFTPLAEKAFNLFANDAGRPLSGIRHNLVLPGAGEAPGQPFELEDLVNEVIDTVSVLEREVKDRQGRWYSLRARPYLTLDNRIDGAVLALVDIDALKRSEQEAEAASKYAEATIRTMRDPLLVLHSDLRVRTANDAFYAMFKVLPEDTVGRLIYELGDGQFNIPALRTLLEDILPRNSYFNDFEITHDFDRIGVRTVLLNGRRLDTDSQALDFILLAIEDITRRKQAEQEFREAGERFRILAESMPQKVFTATATGDIDYFSPQWLEYSGLPAEQIKAHGWTPLLDPDVVDTDNRAWQKALATGEPFMFEHHFRRADGDYRWHVTRALALRNEHGEVQRWVGSSTDIHDVKEADLRKDEFLAMLAHELRNPLAPIGIAAPILKIGPGNPARLQQTCQIIERQVTHMTSL